MAKLVTLTIDGVQVAVPEGSLVVDAAKKVGIDIPVFCYHPKMEPVGICRMCLVEIGRPMIDRATGQLMLDGDGKVKVQFGSKLETACTTPVTEGMVVKGSSEKVKTGRKDILEFLLTSHPLDCPVCDKGGECPLQNLTMGYGPSQSRFQYDEKKHLGKQIPLGELICLDRERCIQCGRCVRFQELIAEDAVIGFSHRGRSMEIISFSDPGFNSCWSGNTTDICPVGALTTSDFRFRSRPWELKTAASICIHCPVGCNLVFNVRREAISGGDWVVKRVVPRQNEKVNEIWICDKGRFGYHFAERNLERVNEPLLRKGGELEAVSWEEALSLVADKFKRGSGGLLTLASGRLSNEDLYSLRKFTSALGGKSLLYSQMAGGEATTQIGLMPGTDFGDMDEGNVILVVGSDLEEEAPLWWLRVKHAAKRGAKLIVLNPRETKLDRAATLSVRYPFGTGAAAVLAMLDIINAQNKPDKSIYELPESVRELSGSAELSTAAKAFAVAKNAMILYGSEGMGLDETDALSQACTRLLLATGFYGRPNNGLLGVWPRANDQGAWEMGWRPSFDLLKLLVDSKVLYIVAADLVSDDSSYLSAFGGEKFVVVQDLFLSQTARLADVVLPAQSWIEREGTFTNGERRVQRFYPAVQATTLPPERIESPSVRRASVLTGIHPVLEGPLPDFMIPALIARNIGIGGMDFYSAAAVFSQLSNDHLSYNGLSYQKLSDVQAQWPVVGREDLYFGGTTYENTQGLGVQLQLSPLQTSSDQGPRMTNWPQALSFKLPKLGMMAFPVARLFDRGSLLVHSKLLLKRIGDPYVVLNALDGKRLKLSGGAMARVSFPELGKTFIVQVRLDEKLPERVVLVPRSYGMPVTNPTPVEIKPT